MVFGFERGITLSTGKSWSSGHPALTKRIIHFLSPRRQSGSSLRTWEGFPPSFSVSYWKGRKKRNVLILTIRNNKGVGVPLRAAQCVRRCPPSDPESSPPTPSTAGVGAGAARRWNRRTQSSARPTFTKSSCHQLQCSTPWWHVPSSLNMGEI